MSRQLGMVLAHGGRFFDRLDEFGLDRAEFIIIAPGHRPGLDAFLDSHDISFSVHCPLVVPDYYPENPLLASVLDFDQDRRRLGVNLMLDTMREAACLGAEYMVVHLQRPEHFGGSNPSDSTVQSAVDIASSSCEVLHKASQELKIPVLLENLMDNTIFNRPETYVELLERFPGMGFCLDVGHLDVDARAFGFTFDEFVETLSPYIRAVHLQNSRTRQSDFNGRHWKIPVHPDQKETGGWLDIEKVLRGILFRNRGCVINFEARLDEDHDHDYMAAGVRWIQELLPQILDDMRAV